MSQIPEALAQIAPAMAQATALKARVLFLCDTRKQAEEVAALAARGLPAHRRVSLERAEAGAWAVQ